MKSTTKMLWLAGALTALTTPVFAQATNPVPWTLSPNMGYAYGKDGKTLA